MGRTKQIWQAFRRGMLQSNADQFVIPLELTRHPDRTVHFVIADPVEARQLSESLARWANAWRDE